MKLSNFLTSLFPHLIFFYIYIYIYIQFLNSYQNFLCIHSDFSHNWKEMFTCHDMCQMYLSLFYIRSGIYLNFMQLIVFLRTNKLELVARINTAVQSKVTYLLSLKHSLDSPIVSTYLPTATQNWKGSAPLLNKTQKCRQSPESRKEGRNKLLTTL